MHLVRLGSGDQTAEASKVLHNGSVAPGRRAWAAFALALAAFAALVLSRRPGALTNAQFWAEDGLEWFARAYNMGPWRALRLPYGGYYQLFPRLTAAIATYLGLELAPLFLSLVSLLLQASVPAFLTTDRFASVVPGRWRRFALGVVLVAAPNLFEVHMNATNGHIHLALLAFLVVVAEPRDFLAWRGFDVAVLVLSGLSGPFCIILAPIAFVRWLAGRHPWSRTILLVVVGTAAIQAWTLSERGAISRSLGGAPLGASSGGFLAILGGQIFVGGLLGLSTYAHLHDLGWWGQPWLPAAAGVVGLAFLLRVAWITRSLALRLLLLYASLHLAASLLSPIVVGDKPLWELLRLPAAGMRYYYFAIMAFLASLAWTLFADPRRAMRAAAAALLALLVLVGIRRDWWLPPIPDLGYAAQVERFRAAPVGEPFTFEIAPPPWQMVLIKR